MCFVRVSGEGEVIWHCLSVLDVVSEPRGSSGGREKSSGRWWCGGREWGKGESGCGGSCGGGSGWDSAAKMMTGHERAACRQDLDARLAHHHETPPTTTTHRPSRTTTTRE